MHEDDDFDPPPGVRPLPRRPARGPELDPRGDLIFHACLLAAAGLLLVDWLVWRRVDEFIAVASVALVALRSVFGMLEAGYRLRTRPRRLR